jgi:mono/diheme cytochrome c family protein
VNKDRSGVARDGARTSARARALRVVAAAAALGLSAAGANAQGLLAAGGRLTPAQAETGKAAYAGACAACHGEGLEGGTGPALKGAAFLGKWNDKTPQALFTVIKDTMPPTAAGSLTPQTALALVAHILQSNGATMGGGAAPAQ